jgi:glucose-6-phosphate-specific signal transduction histidine kinase
MGLKSSLGEHFSRRREHYRRTSKEDPVGFRIGMLLRSVVLFGIGIATAVAIVMVPGFRNLWGLLLGIPAVFLAFAGGTVGVIRAIHLK